NGVVQERAGEAEAWWPTRIGALTTTGMTADKTARATGELASYADRLLLVRGVSHSLGANGCNHASSCAQILTGASTLGGTGNQTVAGSESLDTIVAKQINRAGVEPLFLHAGLYSAGGSGFNVPSYISYVGQRQQRTGIDSPLKAYQKMVGAGATPGGTSDPLALRRKSVNDALRNQMKALQARPELTSEDRQRLDQHFTAIRDLEIKIVSATLTPAQVSQMQAVDPKPYDKANHEIIQQLHMDLMVFGISSGYTRVAVLQVGDREDDHTYTLGGTTFQFHTASHRSVTDAYNLCKLVDRKQITHFKYFLDQLSAIQTPTGPLLNQGVAVNTNQLGTGPDHSMKNLPFVMAGTANGFLAKGKYIDAGNVSTSLMLNTLALAVGVKTSMGGRAGTIAGMLA
ncbi:MAG: DUF1552 domain-containing protein, partial [Deltaproteobacteria bacterium]|nr:DUF1552 domain-containing protein [Deltaproteobacteria bacterium]